MNPVICQGDVMLIPYHGEIPSDAVREPIDPRHGVVLAYGEVTGSAHALDPEVAHVLAPTATCPRLLVIEAAEAILRHAKHPPITLPKTIYRVIQQVEEIEGVAARVAD